MRDMYINLVLTFNSQIFGTVQEIITYYCVLCNLPLAQLFKAVCLFNVIVIYVNQPLANLVLVLFF